MRQNLLILIATSATVAQLLWAIFLVPETCPVETRRPFAWQPADLNPARSLGVFRTSSAMRWLAIAFALQSFAIQGTGSIGQTFVVNKFSLTVAEQSTIGIIVQVSGIVIQVRIHVSRTTILAPIFLKEYSQLKPCSTYVFLRLACSIFFLRRPIHSLLFFPSQLNMHPLSHRRR
jgi:hypothetical protein